MVIWVLMLSLESLLNVADHVITFSLVRACALTPLRAHANDLLALAVRGQTATMALLHMGLLSLQRAVALYDNGLEVGYLWGGGVCTCTCTHALVFLCVCHFM